MKQTVAAYIAKTLEQAGVFKIILHAGNRQQR